MKATLDATRDGEERLLNILLVEDDPMDAETFFRASKEAGLPHRITLATNGEDALDQLGQSDARVELVVMDLKMPRMGGLELLEELKASPRWGPTPAIVLSTSREANDRVAAYRRGAAGFIVKPMNFTAYVDIVRVLDRYWTLNELP